jgi:hypothetical protein
MAAAPTPRSAKPAKVRDTLSFCKPNTFDGPNRKRPKDAIKKENCET